MEHIYVFCITEYIFSVDGDWSEWGFWGTCSVTCSNGTSVRNRTCSNPAPRYGGKNCTGLFTDTQDCIQAACKSKWFQIHVFKVFEEKNLNERKVSYAKCSTSRAL